MRHTVLVRALAISMCFGLLFVAGCPQRTVNLSGKLVLPAKVSLADNDSVTIALAPESEGGKAGVASCSKADMAFTIKDITPGKYKISVSINTYPGEKDKNRPELFKPLNAKYGNPKTTPLNFEATGDGNQSITVDLDKGTVTKG
jgi:hypothetical protein